MAVAAAAVAPAIAERARALTAACRTPRDKATTLHDFVRDQITFGFTPLFDTAAAQACRYLLMKTPRSPVASRIIPALLSSPPRSPEAHEARCILPPVRPVVNSPSPPPPPSASQDTLAMGMGHCIPKSQLFVDLLSAVGIEARVRIVSIDGGVLRGLLPVPPEVTHAFAELRFGPEDPWLALDSFVVDSKLARGARRRLEQEAAAVAAGAPAAPAEAEMRPRDGFGLCGTGTTEWCGMRDAYSQCNGRGGVRWTSVADTTLPPGSSGGACARAAGKAYHNPPWFVMLPLRLLPRFAWDRLLNGRVEETRAVGATDG